MTPDSLTPPSADSAPSTDLLAPIKAESARREQKAQQLRVEAGQKEQEAAQEDREIAKVRIQLAKLGGAQTTSAKLALPKIGELVEGKGIYMGVWAPTSRNGQSLNKKFAVYAAPEDLKERAGSNMVRTFKDMVDEVAKLHNWHGADGGSYANDAMLYEALANGTVVGKWFLPPRELLHGCDVDGKRVREENLLDLRNADAFKGTFVTNDKNDGSRNNRAWYWSCTEFHVHDQPSVWSACFSDSNAVWLAKDYNRLSARPCRVEALTI